MSRGVGSGSYSDTLVRLFNINRLINSQIFEYLSRCYNAKN
ncbi:hypothetical protein FDUTEX481_00761 [Tolypothrix sp. PCC 7601]|nr:hypothetical protein FDUTEX481_00761 [Tolypothrix sp. PCC 7601]